MASKRAAVQCPTGRPHPPRSRSEVPATRGPGSRIRRPTAPTPRPECTEVSVGTVLDAVAGSYAPPPVRVTAPVGKPLALPLNPKPLLAPPFPGEKVGCTDALGAVGRSPQPNASAAVISRRVLSEGRVMGASMMSEIAVLE